MQHKLKALLFEKQMTQVALAKSLGMAQRTFTDKIRGKSDFTYSEVYSICKLLSIENPLTVFIPNKKQNEMR